jgi:hypothetical protein
LIPRRAGQRPRTSARNPHRQLSQNPDPALVQKLADQIFTLPGVEERRSLISVPGARALWLRQGSGAGEFIIGREFAHIHPLPDGSLHALLPLERAEEAIEAGWAEPHPVADALGTPGLVMIYAPRDEAEVAVAVRLVVESYRYAGGGP